MSDYHDEATLAWIRKAQAGDSNALSQVVTIFEKPLKGYIRGRITLFSRDLNAVNDVAQEVWVDVARDIEKTVEEGGYDESRASFHTFIINRYAQFKVLQWKHRNTIEPELFSSLEDSKGRFEQEGPEKTSVQKIIEEEEFLGHKLNLFETLLHLLFLCGGYPHQQLAFGLSKHIFGRENERGVQGMPEKVHNDFGCRTLNDALEAYWALYVRKSRIDDPKLLIRLEKCLDPIRQRLALCVDEMLERDKPSKAQLEKILAMSTAETRLIDYYENRRGSFTTAIPDWSYKVEARIKKVYDEKEGSCPRCKLKHLPPCRPH